MWMALALLSLVGSIASIIGLIVSLFRKRPWKLWVLGIFGSLVLFLIGVNQWDANLSPEEQAQMEAKQQAAAAEKKAKAEAEQKAKAEAEQKAKAEAEQKAKAEAQQANANPQKPETAKNEPAKQSSQTNQAPSTTATTTTVPNFRPSPPQNPGQGAKWNVKDTDVTSNGNLGIAAKILSSLDTQMMASIAERVPFDDLHKAPWRYYGTFVKFRAVVNNLKDYPPGSDLARVLGTEEASEIYLMVNDKPMVLYLIHGSGNIQKDTEYWVYGYPVGQDELVNGFGGRMTGLAVVGKMVSTQALPYSQSEPGASVASNNREAEKTVINYDMMYSTGRATFSSVKSYLVPNSPYYLRTREVFGSRQPDDQRTLKDVNVLDSRPGPLPGFWDVLVEEKWTSATTKQSTDITIKVVYTVWFTNAGAGITDARAVN